jgi:CheY-like chemotaxis protein
VTIDDRLILLVEDREDDILLIQKAFAKAGISNPVHVVRDGEEAITYLSGEGPLPWLVLLDLKMPRKDGFEVLKWIRNVSGLRSVVVVVLTSSERVQDVNEAYQLGANSFLIKPLEFANTVGLAELLQRYWLMHNLFPRTTALPPVQGGAGHDGIQPAP